MKEIKSEERNKYIFDFIQKQATLNNTCHSCRANVETQNTYKTKIIISLVFDTSISRFVSPHHISNLLNSAWYFVIKNFGKAFLHMPVFSWLPFFRIRHSTDNVVIWYILFMCQMILKHETRVSHLGSTGTLLLAIAGFSPSSPNILIVTRPWWTLKRSNTLHDILNSDLAKVTDWAKTWKVKSYPLKTELMTIITKHTLTS